jgi:hypothetical protein
VFLFKPFIHIQTGTGISGRKKIYLYSLPVQLFEPVELFFETDFPKPRIPVFSAYAAFFLVV